MRGKSAKRRVIKADPKYSNLELAKFINYIMYDGKRFLAEKIVYGALDKISNKTKSNPVEVFTNALKNVSPAIEVRSRRVGGANYQIPTPVRADRRFFLACKWLIEAARGKAGKTMADKLAEELMLAAENQGEAFKKKEDVHRMAEANRAFAHFAR